jgi:hypothetical protein
MTDTTSYTVRDYDTGRDMGQRVTDALVAASFADDNYTGAVRARYDALTLRWDVAPESDRAADVVYLEASR